MAFEWRGRIAGRPRGGGGARGIFGRHRTILPRRYEALRPHHRASAIGAVFGADKPVQRCRVHKIRNVAGHLPEGRAWYATIVLRASFRMEEHAKAMVWAVSAPG